MNYNEFTKTIQQLLSEKLDSQTTITIQEIIKNNDTHLDGLTITKEGLNISPTIYLNDYYLQFQSGECLEQICADILDIYETNKPHQSIDISFFTNYDEVKDHIVFKLINFEKNKPLLEKVPYYRYLDLAIVFNCLIDSTQRGSATILIYNQHLDYWNVTRDDLYDLALENTPKLLQYDLRNMTDVLRELLSDFNPADFICEDINQPYPMYVLSNTHKLHGSTCILYQNLLLNFANKMNADLYVLPSSIHEVLLIPAYDHSSYNELTDMVREVNSTQVSEDEILSDHVYYFSRTDNQLNIS